MTTTHKRVLFLDVDGVLNRCADSGFGLQSEQLMHLSKIVTAVDPSIVISSTWRKTPDQLRRLTDVLRGRDARVIGCTPVLDAQEGSLWTARPRGEEISEWLWANGPVDTWAALDDDDCGMRGNPNLFMTRSDVGLTADIAAKVIAHFMT